jgi:hypothetical protein
MGSVRCRQEVLNAISSYRMSGTPEGMHNLRSLAICLPLLVPTAVVAQTSEEWPSVGPSQHRANPRPKQATGRRRAQLCLLKGFEKR